MNQDLQNIVEMAKSRPSGDREAVLAPEVRDQLDKFVEWLRKTEGKTEATARSYRSYMVTALTSGKSWDDLGSDVRSGCRAFARFSES